MAIPIGIPSKRSYFPPMGFWIFLGLAALASLFWLSWLRYSLYL